MQDATSWPDFPALMWSLSRTDIYVYVYVYVVYVYVYVCTYLCVGRIDQNLYSSKCIELLCSAINESGSVTLGCKRHFPQKGVNDLVYSLES